MKKIGIVLIAVVMALGVAGYADVSAAATSLLGTWDGPFIEARPSGYAAGTFTAKVVSQKGSLFRGTVTAKVDGVTFSFGLTGQISGRQVRFTMYDLNNQETVAFLDATFTAMPPTLRGFYRTTSRGNTGSFTLKK